MSVSKPRGVFILLEGLDRSGKTSQCEKLAQSLNQQQQQPKEQEQKILALSAHFPDRTTPTGKVIHSYLQQQVESDPKVIQLLFSANRREKQAWMREQLEQGIHLVVDRYSYSGLAYASSHAEFDLHWSQYMEKGLLSPDIVLFLNVDSNVQQQRGKFGQERYETDETQGKVRQAFQHLRSQAKEYVLRADEKEKEERKSSSSSSSSSPSEYVFGSHVPWYTIDANRSMSDVTQEIQSIALDVISSCQNKALSCF